MIMVERHGDAGIERTTCWSCGCRFSFSALDVHHPPRMDGDDGMRWVKCPDCSQILMLDRISHYGCETATINGPKIRTKPCVLP